MKNYKLVDVLFCRGEIDILGVEVGSGISKDDVLEKKWGVIVENGENLDDGEFYCYDKDVGVISMGEERLFLCIEEGEEMYDIVRGSYNDVEYSEEEMNKFDEYMGL
jgi:hypothetical protein